MLKRRGDRKEAARAVETVQLVAFDVGGEHYGLAIGQVREIERLQPVTKVPKALPFVEGVIRLRDAIIPVIDLAKRFGLPPTPQEQQARIIIARLGAQNVGLIVSRVTEVLTIPAAEIGPAPPLTFDQQHRYVRGMARLKDGLLSVLDLDRLLSAEEAYLLQQQQQSLF